jgi:hypothetical protein
MNNSKLAKSALQLITKEVDIQSHVIGQLNDKSLTLMRRVATAELNEELAIAQQQDRTLSLQAKLKEKDLQIGFITKELKEKIACLDKRSKTEIVFNDKPFFDLSALQFTINYDGSPSDIESFKIFGYRVVRVEKDVMHFKPHATEYAIIRRIMELSKLNKVSESSEPNKASELSKLNKALEIAKIVACEIGWAFIESPTIKKILSRHRTSDIKTELLIESTLNKDEIIALEKALNREYENLKFYHLHRHLLTK